MGQVERYSFIPEHQTDSNFDYDYKTNEDSGFERGGRKFTRPCGWKKIALKIKGRYEDDTWFGGVGKRENEKQSMDGEWAISYHGPKDYKTIAAIINNGYDVDKNERANYGKGIYSSPDPATAEGYSQELIYGEKHIKAMIMNRVHMSYTKVVNRGKFFVTANDCMIRPIAVLIKEV